VALQQTTRELWAQQGPFEAYTIHGVPQQNIPEIYIKGAVWNRARQTLQDTLRNQAHQKNQEQVLGFLLTLTKNTSAGWKYVYRNQQEAKPTGRRSESQDKTWD
jgi:hypothetical protein